MSEALGTEIKAGLEKATDWGTPLEVGADDGLLVKEHTIKKEQPAIKDDSLGTPFPKDFHQETNRVEGDFPMWLRYDSLDLILALAMGATGGAPTLVSSSLAYSQKLTLATLDSLFATIAIYNGADVEEFTTAKIMGFTLTGQPGQPALITFHVLAHNRDEDSSVNTTVTMANVTFPEEFNRVLFPQLIVRMNDESGDALDSADEINPSEYELIYKRNQAGVNETGSFADNINEPRENGEADITLSLTFPRYTNTDKTRFTKWTAKTLKKLDMIFTGALIEETYYRTFKLSFPSLAIDNVDLQQSPGRMPNVMRFHAMTPDAAPSGMTGITKPFQIDLINQKSTDVLA